MLSGLHQLMSSTVPPVKSKWRLNHVKSLSWSSVIWYVSREATLPPQALFHLKCSLQLVPQSSDPSSLPASYSRPSQLAHQGDAIDKTKKGNVDNKHSSAPECTDICYLNDQPALDRLMTFGQSQLHVLLRERTEEGISLKAQSGRDNLDSSPCAATGTMNLGQSIPSSSPGSASQRLENLRRHQHDDKLEKLRECIRRQRQRLPEAAEREKLLDHLERPIATSCANNRTDCSNMAKIRKVAPAPPPPVYKGKIKTSSYIVWLKTCGMSSLMIIYETIFEAIFFMFTLRF